MVLEKLQLQQFRNLAEMNLQFSPQVNIFFGSNAQGKTNLLEAISLLGFGRSFRTKKEAELIRWGADSCFVAGDFFADELKIKMEVGLSATEKRLKENSKAVKSNAFFGKIPVITFGPDDLQLVKGGPHTGGNLSTGISL